MVIEQGDYKINPKIKEWLKLKGWDQRELANQINCHESLVSQWFNEEKPKKPSWNYARKLALMSGFDDVIIFDRNIKHQEER